MMKDNIALIGFMGSGKTTVGRQLAKALDMKFVDIDQIVTKREKRPIAKIFESDGEDYFRNLERQIVKEESEDNNVVISTGGGVIIDNLNIKNLSDTSYIVYLNATIDCIYKRVRNKKHRPLLNTEDVYEKISKLHRQREKLYEISADLVVSIDDSTNVYDTVEYIKKRYIQG